MIKQVEIGYDKDQSKCKIQQTEKATKQKWSNLESRHSKEHEKTLKPINELVNKRVKDRNMYERSQNLDK
ncbi:hypothetical protein HYD68_00700 [Mycoplasmopsis bovis]|nr:hypothetical protein [Mycoplasmopsis bovis]QQH54563.1 hypothetical protein HYD68_00700 [Mycoplasmopsis bovis]